MLYVDFFFFFGGGGVGLLEYIYLVGLINGIPYKGHYIFSKEMDF